MTMKCKGCKPQDLGAASDVKCVAATYTEEKCYAVGNSCAGKAIYTRTVDKDCTVLAFSYVDGDGAAITKAQWDAIVAIPCPDRSFNCAPTPELCDLVKAAIAGATVVTPLGTDKIQVVRADGSCAIVDLSAMLVDIQIQSVVGAVYNPATGQLTFSITETNGDVYPFSVQIGPWVETPLIVNLIDGAGNNITATNVTQSGPVDHTLEIRLPPQTVDVNVSNLNLDAAGNLLLTETDGQTHQVNIPSSPALVVTKNGSTAGVAQSGVLGHTVDIAVETTEVYVNGVAVPDSDPSATNRRYDITLPTCVDVSAQTPTQLLPGDQIALEDAATCAKALYALPPCPSKSDFNSVEFPEVCVGDFNCSAGPAPAIAIRPIFNSEFSQTTTSIRRDSHLIQRYWGSTDCMANPWVPNTTAGTVVVGEMVVIMVSISLAGDSPNNTYLHLVSGVLNPTNSGTATLTPFVLELTENHFLATQFTPGGEGQSSYPSGNGNVQTSVFTAQATSSGTVIPAIGYTLFSTSIGLYGSPHAIDVTAYAVGTTTGQTPSLVRATSKVPDVTVKSLTPIVENFSVPGGALLGTDVLWMTSARHATTQGQQLPATSLINQIGATSLTECWLTHHGFVSQSPSAVIALDFDSGPDTEVNRPFAYFALEFAAPAGNSSCTYLSPTASLSVTNTNALACDSTEHVEWRISDGYYKLTNVPAGEFVKLTFNSGGKQRELNITNTAATAQNLTGALPSLSGSLPDIAGGVASQSVSTSMLIEVSPAFAASNAEVCYSLGRLLIEGIV